MELEPDDYARALAKVIASEGGVATEPKVIWMPLGETKAYYPPDQSYREVVVPVLPKDFAGAGGEDNLPTIRFRCQPFVVEYKQIERVTYDWKENLLYFYYHNVVRTFLVWKRL